MTWKEQVSLLEREGNFDVAIFLLEKVIKEDPDNMDAYIFLLYRLMDLFLENECYWSNVSKDPLKKIKAEYYDIKKWQYVELAQKCFDESYARFSKNTEYLYYTSKILINFYWFIGLNIEESLLEEMYQKAKNSGYNKNIEEGRPSDVDEITWAKEIVNDPVLQEQLATKGAVGKYMVGDTFDCARKILEDVELAKFEN